MKKRAKKRGALSPVLLAEPGALDAAAVKEAFQEGGICDKGGHAAPAEGLPADLDGVYPLILLDRNRPGLGGEKALETIRRDRSFDGFPIILVTAPSAEMGVEMCYSLAENDYIRNPVDSAALSRTVRDAVSQWLDPAFLPDSSEAQERIREHEIARIAAEKASQAKTDFLAAMSHEMRTPLNSILGMLDIMADECEFDDAQHEMLGVVQKCSRSLLMTVNDILDISKIEAGCLELEEVPFCFGETFGALVTTMRPLASQKGLILEAVSPDCKKCLVGDPTRLLRVMLNLVGNAIKYTQKGSVTVKADLLGVDGHADLAMVEFSVMDTGIGIAEDKLQQIFEKYAQENCSMTRRFGGTGLGLCIVKQLVTQMGGEIGVESKPGEGSCFWFRIPFALTDERPVSDEYRCLPELGNVMFGQKRKDAAKMNVLVAEDDPMNQAYMKRLLPRMGIERFEFVETGQDVVDAFHSGKFDMILMDCHMPILSGYEATKQIRKEEAEAKQPAIPIIAMTADAMEDARQQCLEAGMDDCITKPIDRAFMRGLLSRWINFGDSQAA